MNLFDILHFGHMEFAHKFIVIGESFISYIDR
jgi:glycerol-3-phosphate cytidylyltransferase-like family protein